MQIKTEQFLTFNIESQLEDLGLLGAETESFCELEIRSFLRGFKSPEKEISHSCKILQKTCKSHNADQIFKSLCFLHIAMQQLSYVGSDIFKSFLIDLQKELQTKREGKKKKERLHSIQKERLAKGLKINQLKKNKQKNHKHTRSEKQLTQKGHHLHQITSTEQFLSTKIIRPYIAYIQKLIMVRPLFHKFLKGIPLQGQEIWSIINVFSYMFNITKSFEHTLRYYEDIYGNHVTILAKITFHQIRIFYPIITEYVHNEKNRLKKAYRLYQNLANKAAFVEIMKKEYKVQNMFKLLEQMGRVNQELIIFNKSRLFTLSEGDQDVLNKRIRTDSQSYNFIYKLCRTDKTKSEQKLKVKSFSTISTAADDERMKKNIPLNYKISLQSQQKQQKVKKHPPFKTLRQKVVDKKKFFHGPFKGIDI